MYFLTLPIGIVISHLYRLFVIRIKLLERILPVQLISIVFFSVIKGVLFFSMTLFLSQIIGLPTEDLNLVFVLESVINFTVIFCLWNIIYFGFHYFQNYKKSEINSLRYLAASKESQLMSLKAQLNPHFIFNCMNSIRALIDEDPLKAKDAVTRLSNILRNTLLLNKKKEITIKEEMNLVTNYLDLEHIRYEERLNYDIHISEEVTACLIPPFIIQSQVENAIKHGISSIPGKGNIYIEAFIKDGELRIKVSNTGKLNTKEPLTGVGFKNSIQRIELLYGNNGNLKISEQDDLVVVDIHLPLKKSETPILSNTE